ncbi:cation diffusion facilitator family transporter [Fontibacillus solani]|uniref:Cation diffusion facilitator family transporter n=1 Tax=Fontibacillus solani TaxID=1572857 RepID=A0A7W3SXX9_9BACL|nr:cation diffusion facilitator family transporter [Fontibacillus solani]MBA9088275.1 cation diffusion facilitator family transporter [Fontibacillus solani]
MTREQTVQADSMTWLGIVNHVVLSLLKGIVGLLFDSPALLAGGLYSASDAAAIVVKRVKLPHLRKQTGATQRIFTHKESIRPLVAIMVSVVLLLCALQLGISSITALSEGNVSAPGYMAGVAIVIAIAIKEAVFQFQYRWWRNRSPEDTQSLIESHRYSLYSSIAILIGVIGAMTGQAWDLEAMIYLDTVASLFVVCLLIWRVYRLISTSIYDALLSERQEDTTSFIETVQRVHGIIAVEDLKARERGHYVTVDAKISVNPRLTVQEANIIANRAKVLLMSRFSHVSDVSILILPYDPGYPYKSNHDDAGDNSTTLIQ